MTDRYIELRHSKDGGENWSDWTQHHMGEVGAYMTRVVKRRMGIARQMVVEWRISSPVKATIIGMSVQVE